MTATTNSTLKKKRDLLQEGEYTTTFETSAAIQLEAVQGIAAVSEVPAQIQAVTIGSLEPLLGTLVP